MQNFYLWNTGSGKSTFAKELSEKLKLPLYHLDKFFFVERWKERNYEEFIYIQKKMIQNSAWIVDGNAMRSLELRFEKGDIAIYFTFNRWLCLFRVIKRIFFPDPSINDLAEGCRKSIRFKLIKYIFLFRKKYSERIEELARQYPKVRLIKVRKTRELQSLMKMMEEICQKKDM